MEITVFCVGNKLYLDDGLGPAVYEEVLERFDIPSNVKFHDVGCMSMDGNGVSLRARGPCAQPPGSHQFA